LKGHQVPRMNGPRSDLKRIAISASWKLGNVVFYQEV
jgi:hypothetical protein